MVQDKRVMYRASAEDGNRAGHPLRAQGLCAGMLTPAICWQQGVG